MSNTTTKAKPVMAVGEYRTNGELVAACAQLGYLLPDKRTLDPTFGKGTFWKVWQPDVLLAHDLDEALSPAGESIDATRMPYADRSIYQVVIDGPYKLNGTPDPGVNHRVRRAQGDLRQAAECLSGEQTPHRSEQREEQRTRS